jgi:hypothetical protein
LSLIGCGAPGPLSEAEKQAAEDEFQNLLADITKDDDRQAYGVLGWMNDKWQQFKEGATTLTLCKVLRPLIERNPDRGRLVYFNGHITDATLAHFHGKLGREALYDFQNYQAVAYEYAAVGLGTKLAGLYQGVYTGGGYGYHQSALALAGPRHAVTAEVGIPLLSRLPIVGNLLKGTVTYFNSSNEPTRVGALALGGKMGLGVSNPIKKLLPLSGVELQYAHGHWIPFDRATAEIAQRDADLGARLRVLPCPQGGVSYVAYGNPWWTHTQRSAALSTAMNRSTISIDLLGKAMAVAISGLGVARDKGGFHALCEGGWAMPPEPPPPPPRCDNISFAKPPFTNPFSPQNPQNPGTGPNNQDKSVAQEGEGCWKRPCAQGLQCVDVLKDKNGSYNLQSGELYMKHCMEGCTNLGSDSNCEGGETCTASPKGRVCFNSSKSQSGFTDLK